MLKKSFAIVTLFIFSLSFVSFSQDTKDAPEFALLQEYQSFLEQAKLSHLIRASSFVLKDTINGADSSGRKPINVLTLKANSKYENALPFAIDWTRKVKEFETFGNLYELLFTKLVTYSNVLPENLIIQLDLGLENDYSFKIYFLNGIQVKMSGIGIKGDIAVDGPGDLNNSLYGGIIERIPITPNLGQKLRTQLKGYLKALTVDAKESNVIYNDWADGKIMYFEVRNIKGKITEKFNELIFLNINVTPLSKDRATISFLYTIKYKSGVFNLNDDSTTYVDVIKSYPHQLTKFAASLKEQLYQIVK